MGVIFTRVDDRLIHGQVVQGWLPGLKADEAVVVLRGADELSRSLMRMALPEEYSLKILTPEECAAYVNNSQSKIFLVFENLEDLRTALAAGLKIKSVNVGGLHYKEGREKVLKDVYLSPAEKKTLKNLISSGIEADGRSVPNEPHARFDKIL